MLVASIPLATVPADAQAADAVASWIALRAPTGRETDATDAIAHAQSGWTRDASGNLIARRGSGAPRRVVACGLDDAGYVVSDITDAGYIRLEAATRTRHSLLWNQFHEGQRVRVLTATGPRPAVVAVRSTHLWRRRPTNEPVTSIDDLWVDVGAKSRADVATMGIAVLDPVEREWPVTRFADFVAGPAAAARAGCAAVAASVAGGAPKHGETIWIIGVEHVFADAGLAGAMALIDPGLVSDSTSTDAVPRKVLPNGTVILGLRTRYAGTLVETVRDRDI